MVNALLQFPESNEAAFSSFSMLTMKAREATMLQQVDMSFSHCKPNYVAHFQKMLPVVVMSACTHAN